MLPLFFTALLLCSLLCAQGYSQELSNSGRDSLAFQMNYRLALELNDPKPDSALVYARKAEEIARKRQNRKEISLALSVIASALTDGGKSVEALQQGKQALFLAQECQDTLAIAWAYFSIGYASGQRLDGRNNDSLNSVSALLLLKDGLSFCLRTKDTDLTTNYFNAIGRIFRKMGKFDSAVVYHTKAYRLAQQTKNLVQQGWAGNSIALCYESLGRLREALVYAEKAVEIRKKVGNPFPIAISMGGMAVILSKMGDKDKALQFAKSSLLYADSSGLQVTRTAALERISNILAERQEYKEAFEYYRRYVALRDSVIMQEQSNDVRTLAQELEIERNKKERALLLQQQQEQKALLQQQRVVGYSIAIVVVMLTIAIIAVLRVQRLTKYKQILAERYAHTIEHTNRQLDEANSALHQKNQQLEQINAEKEEILSIVAHDLKNPIGALYGLGELIAEGTLDSAYTAQVGAQISQTSVRMLELVTKLLDVSRLEAGVMTFHNVELNMTPIVEGVIAQYAPAAELKGITLNFANNADNYIVIADEQATMQVLDNLISNAVKYSPHGKNVFIRLCAEPTTINQKPTTIRIEVQDEGPGISEDDMKKLFGKFARLSARPTGGEHSTGLGLSIVKKMVEAMNGRVWCESELGKGATFIVELPKSA